MIKGGKMAGRAVLFAGTPGSGLLSFLVPRFFKFTPRENCARVSHLSRIRK